MPHDYHPEPRTRPTLKELQEYKDDFRKKEHALTVQRNLQTFIAGLQGALEPSPGQFTEIADYLISLGKDPVLEQILTQLDTAGAVKALLTNREAQKEKGTTKQPPVKQEHRKDGTTVITNPGTSVVIVTVRLLPFSEPVEIRLSPGETKEFKPTITSRDQTTEEWLAERSRKQDSDFANAVARKKEDEREDSKWNRPTSGGGFSSSSHSH